MNYILIILLITAIGLVMFDLFQLGDKRTQCLKNPLTYGVREWGRINNDEVYCSCSFAKGGVMLVTKENITFPRQERNLEINLSYLNEVKEG